LAISEHGLKDDEITQCTLEGYTVVSHFCRKEHKGGGIAIYSSKNILQYKTLKWITEKSIEKIFEVAGIELIGEKGKIIIIALYRSPSGILHEFFIQLIGIFEQLVQKDCYTIIVGDFNINTQEDGCDRKQLLDVINAYNLTMTINVPTRVTESLATIIDQIITNMPLHCYSTDVINSLLSDHYAQCITINMNIPQQIRCYREGRNVSEANIIGLCSSIQNETWIEVFCENDVEKKWDSFYSTFNYYFNIACLKVRRNIVSASNVPWIKEQEQN
jgi:exonuclease III